MASKEFYKNAHAYDIAFSDREFETECDLLEWFLRNHSKIDLDKLNKLSFTELACGPGRHAREFAKRGWRSVALDLSEDMVNYAAKEAEKSNLPLEAIHGDMIDYSIKEPVALTATVMESISHILTNEQMILHFRSVAKNTLPGGIYVIEATHPRYFFPDEEANIWVSKEGNIEVEITFGVPGDEYNSVTQQWMVTNIMRYRENGKELHEVVSVSPIRWYLAQEMKALIELSGVFDECWFYGSMYGIPPKELDDNENSDAMVIVLRVK